MVIAHYGMSMPIQLSDHESVRRHGESFSIGDRVYSIGRASFGVGYIQEIEVLGVHFGFRAKISSTILDEPQWYDAKSLSHDIPGWAEAYESETNAVSSS